MRPTPAPLNVSLGATHDSTPIQTVLRTHLFFVAWLPRLLSNIGRIGCAVPRSFLEVEPAAPAVRTATN